MCTDASNNRREGWPLKQTVDICYECLQAIHNEEGQLEND